MQRYDQSENWRGRCFEASLRYQDDHPEWLLVHALVYHVPSDQIMIHAWCERGEEVFDASLGRSFVRSRYYTIHAIRHKYVYAWDEMAALAVASGTYGPWEQSLLENPEWRR